jgi:hypothetical protein
MKGLVLLGAVLCGGGCGGGGSNQPFNKAKWKESRKSNPNLNACPLMLDDLLTSHLSLGMSLADVTNLIGQPEIKQGLRIRGEYQTQAVYVYRPGIHNGWLVHDAPLPSAHVLRPPFLREKLAPDETNCLVLRFGCNGEYLKEWFPSFPIVQPVNATPSEATRNLLPELGLHIGNLRFAAMPDQFYGLLGPPDVRRTEWQLDYYLGKRSPLVWDEVFLELHFDGSQKLSRMSWSEH